MPDKTDSKTKEPAQFVWFETYAKALEAIPDEEREKRAEFALAIAEYGSWGIEPSMNDWPLKPAFEAIRENLDRSVRNYKNGKKGGRPKSGGSASSKRLKKPAEEAAATRSPETSPSESQKGVLEPSEAEDAVVWDETDLLEWHE